MAPKYRHKKQVQYKPNPNKKNSKQIYLIGGILAVVLIIVGVYFVGGFGSGIGFFTSDSDSDPQASPTGSASVTPAATPNMTPATSDTKVLLETSKGNITIQLFDDKPITTQNFLNLVAAGKYDGTVFHRIMKGFMIQGGAINENLPTIKDEIGSNNHNYKYTIAMAKTQYPDSASSGFFINTVDNSGIAYQDGTTFDSTYTAFGRVIEGKDIVDAISNVPVTTNAANEKSQPLQTVTLISAKIIS